MRRIDSPVPGTQRLTSWWCLRPTVMKHQSRNWFKMKSWPEDIKRMLVLQLKGAVENEEKDTVLLVSLIRSHHLIILSSFDETSVTLYFWQKDWKSWSIYYIVRSKQIKVQLIQVNCQSHEWVLFLSPSLLLQKLFQEDDDHWIYEGNRRRLRINRCREACIRKVYCNCDNEV